MSFTELLIAPKDKLSKDEQCGLVYKVDFSDCPASYVGETGRALQVRMAEQSKESSVVESHANDTGHMIRPDRAKILDKEENWFKRRICEVVYIKIHQSRLNRDGGRYYLPAIYSSLLGRLSPPGGTATGPVGSS